MNIVINNTEPRLIELPSVAPRVATGKEIEKEAVLDAKGVMVTPTHFTQPGTLLKPGYDLQQLSPGENDVDAGYWAVISQMKPVKMLIAVGYLENLGEGTATTLVADLDKVDVSTAKLMISECPNIAVLTQWADGTDNRGLLKLIGERKAELIDKADGQVKRARGPRNTEVDLGTFGDGTTGAQVDGTGDASHGIGEQAGA